MLLPSSPRCRRQRRASLLVLAAVLLCFIPVSASLPARTGCPSHSECQNQKRVVDCKAGSKCGPCLPLHEEAEDGSCVQKPRKARKVKTFSDLEEEIDFIHSVIEKQEKIRKKPTKQKPAIISFQRDREEGLTDTLKLKDRLLTDVLQTSTEAPRHATNRPPNETTLQSKFKGGIGHGGPHVVQTSKNDSIIIILVSLFVVMGSVAVIMAAACYVKLQMDSRLTEKVDYPAFKGTGVSAAKTTDSSQMGDNTLAKSAQMYHYKHQKQQMISMGNNKPEQKPVDSEFTSDEEEVGGGFTVYECPGLAPTGEMEVKNPLFDDSTMEYQENKK